MPGCRLRFAGDALPLHTRSTQRYNMPPKSTFKPTKVSAPVQKSRWKKPTTPKKTSTTQEQLKRLFTTLCAQIDGGHFSNAVKTCDKSALL